MDSFYLIEQKCNTKCLTPNERQLLNMDIHYVFVWLIETEQRACPSLTDEDVLFCCLTKLGLDNSIICRCMGSANKQAANQRKYRVKKKMKAAQCDFLFDIIFTPAYVAFP